MDVNSNQVTEAIDGVLYRLDRYSPDDLPPIDLRVATYKRVEPMPYREQEIPPNNPSTWSPEECLKWLQIEDGNANS